LVRFGKKINLPAAKFISLVRGERFRAVRRRAKILILDLTNEHSLLIHLKMTGRLLYVPKDSQPTKHTHAIFSLSDGKKLFWEDIRKFGYIKVMPTGELDGFWRKEGYGPEPLGRDFSLEIFKQCLLKSPRKKIKPRLLDQTCLAGIGNIYADEGLWYAGVLPMRRAGALKETELRKLYNGLRKVLLESIKYRGTSADSYLDAFGRAGEFVPRLKAYGREGERCARRDSGIIKKIRLGGRGTHFCPTHQK
jgi:formamidopyrimidine-DNA glycosylase